MDRLDSIRKIFNLVQLARESFEIGKESIAIMTLDEIQRICCEEIGEEDV